MITIFIDTHLRHKAECRLLQNGNCIGLTLLSGTFRSEDLIVSIEHLLEEHSFTMEEINAIKVHTGPGPFTGIRVGIIVARTLALLYRLPINGSPVTKEITPKYEKSHFDDIPS